MKINNELPIIFLVEAKYNPKTDHLKEGSNEFKELKKSFEEAEKEGFCELVDFPQATLNEVLQKCQQLEYRNRLTILHYIGHANSKSIGLANPHSVDVDPKLFAQFLQACGGLQLIFLNACLTEDHISDFIKQQCKVVIGTKLAIDDSTAKEFATNFYTLLLKGDSINSAFDLTNKYIQTYKTIDQTYSDFRGSFPDEPLGDIEWPWVIEGSDEDKNWKIPKPNSTPSPQPTPLPVPKPKHKLLIKLLILVFIFIVGGVYWHFRKPDSNIFTLNNCNYKGNRSNDKRVLFLIPEFDKDTKLGNIQLTIYTSINESFGKYIKLSNNEVPPVYICNFKLNDEHDVVELGIISAPSIIVWGFIDKDGGSIKYQYFKPSNDASTDYDNMIDKIHILTNPSMSKPISITRNLIEQKSNFLTLYILAQGLFTTDDYTTTRILLKDSINALDQFEPDTENQGLDEAYFQLGWSQVNVESVNQGLATMDKGMAFTQKNSLPANTNILYHRAYLYTYRADNHIVFTSIPPREEYTRAISDLLALDTITPNDPKVYNQLGYIYYRLAQLSMDEARDEYLKEARKWLILGYGLEFSSRIVNPSTSRDGTILKNLGLLQIEEVDDLKDNNQQKEHLLQSKIMLTDALTATMRPTAKVQALLGLYKINRNFHNLDCESLKTAQKEVPDYAYREKKEIETFITGCR